MFIQPFIPLLIQGWVAEVAGADIKADIALPVTLKLYCGGCVSSPEGIYNPSSVLWVSKPTAVLI